MNIEKTLRKLNIGAEHKPSLEEINKYVEEHKIQEMFNVNIHQLMQSFQEILTNILNERPGNAKEYIIQYLQKAIHPDKFDLKTFPEPFLYTEDFEAIFDSYDVLGIQTVPRAYLIQALSVVGVENGKQVIQERYPELVNEEFINKVTFVYVLEEENKRAGFSYN